MIACGFLRGLGCVIKLVRVRTAMIRSVSTDTVGNKLSITGSGFSRPHGSVVCYSNDRLFSAVI